MVNDEMTIEDLRDLLTMALAENDLRTLEQVAELAVDALGRVGNGIDGSSGQSGFSAYQTLDRMQPQTTLVAALAARLEVKSDTVPVPFFLSRTELGQATVGGRIPLTGYEVAAKLALAITGSGPDKLLLVHLLRTPAADSP